MQPPPPPFPLDAQPALIRAIYEFYYTMLGEGEVKLFDGFLFFLKKNPPKAIGKEKEVLCFKRGIL